MASDQAFPSAFNGYSLGDLIASVVKLKSGEGLCCSIVPKALGFQDGLIKEQNMKRPLPLPHCRLAASCTLAHHGPCFYLAQTGRGLSAGKACMVHSEAHPPWVGVWL